MDNCQGCRYATKSTWKTAKGEVEVVCCRLTSIIHKLTDTCEYCNKDLSALNICYNCKHYLGGHDWGLSCAKEYMKLVHFNDEACESFERREKDNTERRKYEF